jgi:SNF2 family DNA or RNA helicase
MPEFYHDRTRNLLVYQTRGPFIDQQLVQAVPEAKQINGKYFAVPCNLRNSQILRLFDYPVPPVMDSYDWPRHPSIEHPYETQKLAANFMLLHPRSFNLSDMGTGKTLAVLWAADQLMRWQPGLKALIVCPLSIMQRVWADAIFQNFLNKRTFTILYGTAEKRVQELGRAVDFYVCNFDGVGVGAHTRKRFELDGFSKALSERNDIKLAIIDEASAYKDSSTKRHRIARIVFGQKPYLWLLTGTPTPTAPTDAYGLAKLVNNAMGKSKQTFQMETMYQPFPQSFKWLPKRDGYDKARALLRPAIRVAIEDVWDGPEMTTQVREVPLTDEQKKLMLALKRDFIVQVKSGAAIQAVNEAAARIKFIQISLGAIYDAGHKAHGIDAKPRYEELTRVLEEAPGKCLIFAPLTSVINLIYNNISKRWPTEIVNGEVSQRQRSDIFRAFQSTEKPRIIVADPGTMSHGLDLFAARTVIWFGPTEKPELYAQANKRAHRPGQKFPVTIVQLVSNPLEREIFRRLENNLVLQGALLDLVKQNAI